MSITINKSKCTGCGLCAKICPGNIIRLNDTGKAYLKRPSDCWSCMCCMKECRFGAITLILSPEMEGNGGELTIRTLNNRTEWTIDKADGSRVILVTDTAEANNY